MLSVLQFFFRQRFLLITALLLAVLQLQSCNKPTEPPSPPKTEFSFELKLADVYCTEVWLNSNAKKDINIGDTLLVISDNSILLEFIQNTLEKEIYIDGLLPGKEYVFYLTDKERKGQSAGLKTKTLDTTDHNYTWQKFEFGEIECGSSYFYDVAIVDENNIWAVGSIKSKDSLGNCHTQSYNAVHWDGDKWELKRIMFYTICGQTSLTSYPAKSIFVFNDGDIWISSSGDKIAILKESVQIDKFCLPSNVSMSINKLWGSSSNNLYAVGDGGNIVHWNGNSWKKIESGTNVNLRDIYGTSNGVTAWACGYSNDYGKTTLIRINNKKTEVVFNGSSSDMNNNEYIGPIAAIWCSSNYFLYVTNWAFIYKQPDKNLLDIKRITPWYGDVAFAMRGTGHNDISIAGQHGLVGHYNGMSYKEHKITQINGQVNFYGIATREKVVTIVGKRYDYLTSKAVILLGRR